MGTGGGCCWRLIGKEPRKKRDGVIGKSTFQVAAQIIGKRGVKKKPYRMGLWMN
jgi:hypothetical protein